MGNTSNISGELIIKSVADLGSQAERFLAINDVNKVVSRTSSQVRSDIGAKAQSDEQILVLDISRGEHERVQIANGVYRFLVPKRINVRNIFVDLASVPDGGATVIDVEFSSSSILQDPLTIHNGQHNNLSNPSTLLTTVFNVGDVLIFNVMDVAPSLPGGGLKAYILYY